MKHSWSVEVNIIDSETDSLEELLKQFKRNKQVIKEKPMRHKKIMSGIDKEKTRRRKSQMK